MASPTSSSYSVSSHSADSYYSCSGSSRADEVSPSHSSSLSSSLPASAGGLSSGSSTPVSRSRPLSCSEVMPKSSELSIASTSSCSSATITPKAAAPGSRPASTDSAGSGGPSTRTLVQPRSWRVVPRSRGGHSLDRKCAMEEDTSLEGDDLFFVPSSTSTKERDDDAGSSNVDGGGDDVFTSTSTHQNGGGSGAGSSVDPVRAKSESDILGREKDEENNNTATTKHVVGFKTKAQRFSSGSQKENGSTLTSVTSASSSSTIPRLSSASRHQQLQQQRSKSLTMTPVSTHPLSLAPPDKSPTRAPARSDSSVPGSSMSRSITLPLESNLVRRAANGDIDSAGSASANSRKSRSPTRTMDAMKSVKFSEPDHSKPDTTNTQTRSASADKSPEDSPSRTISVNVHSSTARVSFTKASKPATATSPPPPPPPPPPPQDKPQMTLDQPMKSDMPPQAAASETLVTLRRPLVWVDKPEVRTKPTRSGMFVNGQTSPRSDEIPAKPPRLYLNGQTSPTEEPKKSPTWTANMGYSSSTLPRTSTPGQVGRRSATLSAAQSPVEDVLFSMGFTIAEDEGKKRAQPPQTQPKPKLLPEKSLHRANVDDVSYRPQTTHEPAPKNEEAITPNTHADLSVVLRKGEQHPLATPGVVPVCSATTEASDAAAAAVADNATTAIKTNAEPPVKEIGIIPKKMTKIKGDSSSRKAEEKAAKARKKAEQKAKEKELKAKKKSGASSDDSSDHHPEKVRLKLFPFKVEFSKDKHKNNPPSKNKKQEDAAARADSKKKNLDLVDGKNGEVEKMKMESGSSVTSLPSGGIAASGVLISEVKQHVDLEVEVEVQEVSSSAGAAASKKTDKGDGNCSSASTSSSSKSPTDRKGPPSSSSSPQEPPSPQPQPPPQQQQPESPPSSPLRQKQQLQQPSPSPQTMQDPLSSPRRPPSASPQLQHRPQQPSPAASPQPQRQQQQHQQQPPPKPRHSSSADDPAASSSDQNSDMDSQYGSLQRRNRQGKSVQISESDGETTPQGSLRRTGPRRHTVGSAQIREQMQHLDATERKREAFYELLASRYPQYADKITGLADYHQPTTAAHRNPRPREPLRRRTTAVTYNPHVNRSLDYEDLGTMSDVELSSFQRGGYARGSLPIVRSASTSLERPIGLVFLVFRDETKKALLPNEITSLDTVRALFVRAFPEKLTMEYLDSPKRKIYILEAATGIFFQLEDLRDIQDRTVLKIHECDSEEPQRVKCQPEVRGRAVQPGGPPSSRPASRQGFVGEGGPHFRDEMAKTQSLPVSAAQGYQDMMQKERGHWEMEHMDYILQQQQRRSRSRSQTPEPAERPRSLSTGAPRSRYSHSPDRLLSSTTPDRGGGGGGSGVGGPAHLNPIPENPRVLANGFRDSAAVNGGSHYDLLAGSHSHHPHQQQHPHQLPHHQQQLPHHQHPSHPAGHASHLQAVPPPQGRGVSPTPIYESVYQAGGYPYPQAYVSHSMRATPQQGPQRATAPPSDMRGGVRGGPPNRHSLAFAAMSNPIYDSFPQRAQSYRATSERDVLPPRPQSATPHEMQRMDRMESQIASLAAWVHQVHAPPTEPGRRGPGSSRSTSSGHSEGTDTYPGSSASSLSDIPAAYSLRKPVVTGEMKEKINDLQCRMQELRVELQGLRRLEQLNQEAMRDAFSDTLHRLKNVMSSVPGADSQVVRHLRVEVDSVAEAYMQDKVKVEKDLSDLETCVEELKEDVITRKCRINVSDVEGLALMLSNITKSLADLKGHRNTRRNTTKVRFPQVHESLRKVMSGEMEIVVKEEKFLKEEPLHIEAALKRCKKLTSTLCTLKRLATIQDSRPPHIPTVASECNDVGEQEKMAVLESIRAMVPDHDTRLQCLEAADASRERKKKIVTQQESLKFTKSLQTASKALRTTDNTQPTSSQSKGDGGTVTALDSKTVGASGVQFSQDKRSEQPPAIPAKPARLMSASEVKKLEAGRRVNVEDTGSESSQSDHHAITVTGQVISDGGDHQRAGSEAASSAHRSSARSAFFSSMQSSSTSPPPDSSSKAHSTSRLPSSTTTTTSSTRAAESGASSGPSSSSTTTMTSPSRSKAQQGFLYQAVSPTRGRSAFSSIPLPSKPPTSSSSSADKDDSSAAADKGKKVPPPPPPRRSSAKLPYGMGVVVSSSSTSSASSSSSLVSSSVNTGSGMVESATVRRNSSSDKADPSRRKDSLGYKAVGSPATVVTSSCTGPLLSSTPKPVTPQKPQQATSMNKFQKDLAAGIYSNMNRPDLQNQKIAPDRVLNTMASPAPAAVTTNSQDPQPDDADLSSSESTGSSTSLDSQQGAGVLLRANSIPTPSSAGTCRGPKPNPPQRHSSLSAKGSVSDDFSSNSAGIKTKTQMLQERVRRSQDEGKPGSGGGLLSSQMNGLTGAKNGHKT